MKACAEKHVLEALALQEQSKQPQTVDVVASALEYLNELDRCPGPKCNVPFEHYGEHMESVHLSLSHSLQVDVRPCFAPVAKSIIVCGAGASSSQFLAASTRMIILQRTTTFLIAKKLRMTSRKY
jgi:hypothetical protein